MLLPDYDELVGIRSQTGHGIFGSIDKSRSSIPGGHASLFKGRGLDFSEFREYAAGDDVRAIDWRVTARTGRPHTKLFTEEREHGVFVIVDLNGYMEFGTRRTFKSIQAARAAAHIAWRANELHDAFGAILFGQVPGRVEVLAAKRSRKSVWELLKRLSAPQETEQEVPLDEAIALANRRIPLASSVFVISDFFEVSAALEHELEQLTNRRDVTLVKVSDPAEQSLPKVDDIRFSSGSGAQLLVNTNDPGCGDQYRKLWEASDASLRVVAHKFRAKLINLSTDRDVSRDLFRGTGPSKRRVRA